MFVHIGRCAPVKIDAFFRSVRLDSVLVHGLGLDRDFKGWMGEVWKREFAEWSFGPSGRVWGPFFFFKPRVSTRGSQWWAQIILSTDEWGD